MSTSSLQSRTLWSVALCGALAAVTAFSPALGQFRDDDGTAPPIAEVAQNTAPPPPTLNAADAEKATEVLTSGPIHEGFAGPIVLDAKPGVVIEKEPPKPIEELPPEQKPDGKNVVWINGYWQWDDQRDSFIWISGVWRDTPPGRRWVPGYWAKVETGWQWVSGFWNGEAAEADEVEYQDEAPPPSVENGPSSPQPSTNHFWVPGTYVVRETRYVWEPGFWNVCYPDWVWVPRHWQWTPAGWILVGGGWDYVVPRRGLCFSPVYYNQPIYGYAGYRWRPSICFNVGALSVHLFARPSHHHYYCGDYYGSNWGGRGYVSWVDIHRRRDCYDPWYAHQKWYHTNHLRQTNWEAGIVAKNGFYRDNVNSRPPRTYADLRNLERRGGLKADDIRLASTLNDVPRLANNNIKLVKLDKANYDRATLTSQKWRDFQNDRSKLEVANAIKTRPGRPDGDNKVGDNKIGDNKKGPDAIGKTPGKFDPNKKIGANKKLRLPADVAKIGGGNPGGNDPKVGDVVKLPGNKNPGAGKIGDAKIGDNKVGDNKIGDNKKTPRPDDIGKGRPGRDGNKSPNNKGPDNKGNDNKSPNNKGNDNNTGDNNKNKGRIPGRRDNNDGPPGGNKSNPDVGKPKPPVIDKQPADVGKPKPPVIDKQPPKVDRPPRPNRDTAPKGNDNPRPPRPNRDNNNGDSNKKRADFGPAGNNPPVASSKPAFRPEAPTFKPSTPSFKPTTPAFTGPANTPPAKSSPPAARATPRAPVERPAIQRPTPQPRNNPPAVERRSPPPRSNPPAVERRAAPPRSNPAPANTGGANDGKDNRRRRDK